MTEQITTPQSESSADRTPQHLGKSTRAGARWQLFSQVVDLASAMVIMLLLAHFVAPDEFGLVAWRTAAVMIFAGVLVAPVGSAIVAKQIKAGAPLDTAWWLAQIPTNILFIGSVVLALALGTEGLNLTIVIGVGISLPFIASRQVLACHLQQSLEFRRLATSRVVGACGSTAASLALLAAGEPVVALIARTTLAPLIQSLYILGVIEWMPRLRFDRPVSQQILKYSRGVAGFNAVNQFSRRGDDIIVGGLVSSHALGLYSIAYRFIEVPVGQVGMIAENVAFPAIVRIKEEASMRTAFLRSQRMLVWFAAPVSIAAVALGDLAIPAFLGAEWTDAGPIVQVFGPIAFLQTASTLAGIIFLYRSATGLLMKWGMAATSVNLVCFIVGARWGALGVAWAYLVAALILFYPSWYFPGRLIDLKPSGVIKNLSGPTAIAIMMVLALVGLRQVIPLSGVIPLTLTIITLSVLYWALTIMAIPSLRTDVLTTIRSRE